MNPRGGGYSEPRSLPCTPAWVTEQDPVSINKNEKEINGSGPTALECALKKTSIPFGSARCVSLFMGLGLGALSLADTRKIPGHPPGVRERKILFPTAWLCSLDVGTSKIILPSEVR